MVLCKCEVAWECHLQGLGIRRGVLKFYRPSPEPPGKLCKFKTLNHLMFVEYVVAK